MGTGVVKLPHEDSFESEGGKTHKNTATADGFALLVFLKMLLVFERRRPYDSNGDLRS
jgi:hypothetical protein